MSANYREYNLKGRGPIKIYLLLLLLIANIQLLLKLSLALGVKFPWFFFSVNNVKNENKFCYMVWISFTSMPI